MTTRLRPEIDFDCLEVTRMKGTHLQQGQLASRKILVRSLNLSHQSKVIFTPWLLFFISILKLHSESIQNNICRSESIIAYKTRNLIVHIMLDIRRVLIGQKGPDCSPSAPKQDTSTLFFSVSRHLKSAAAVSVLGSEVKSRRKWRSDEGKDLLEEFENINTLGRKRGMMCACDSLLSGRTTSWIYPGKLL